jgi:hypothetical protein
MTRPWLGSFATVMMMLLACGDDVDEAGDGGTGDSSSSEGSNTNPTTDPSATNPSTDPSADGSETTDNDTGPDDTGPTETGSTGGSSDGSETTNADTSATDSMGDSGSSSSGEPPSADYPMCMSDDDCSDPYTLCWPPEKFGEPTFCTLECEAADECPVPSTGEAVPVCEGPPGTNICALDCTEGECPDGMECVDIFGNGAFMRCTYA